MKDKLYFIANAGCDATTYGIARISDEDFPKFKTIIENLNQNSYYGCMPTIQVFNISPEMLKQCNKDKDDIDLERIYHLDGKTFTWADEYFHIYDLERVI